MPPRRSNEGLVLLAIAAFNSGQCKSLRQAAEAFEVSHATVSRRAQGVSSQRGHEAPNRVFNATQEQKLTDIILGFADRGLPVTLQDVAADAGLAPVGLKWPTRFISRTPELKTKISRPTDYKRVLNEKPEDYKSWFEVYLNTKIKYGVADEDVYNFDETGFQMELQQL